MGNSEFALCISILFCIIIPGFSTTDPNDATVLSNFRKGLDNPEVLKWPSNENDPCGPPIWPHVFCSKGRVTQIQVANLGLKGTLPQNFNQLTKLRNLGLQHNQFNGKLPSFSGLSELESAYLDSNEFDTIPLDFFHGLDSVTVLALDNNPFNATSGWAIPDELQNSAQLGNFSCSGCNIVGEVPDFFGKFPSLTTLELSYNRLSGPIPSSLKGSTLKNLWLNDQEGDGMSGSIDIIASMSSLIKVWLHGNQFSGSIPENIGELTSLKELNLNRNQLVGRIPPSLASMDLDKLDLNNNLFVGSIPKFKTRKVTYASNDFCDSNPGVSCSPQVDALLEFLRLLNYPLNIVSQWSGNDPCKGPWIGLLCNSKGEIMTINIQNHNLNGTLSPSLADLGSLEKIYLDGNNIHGQVPANLTQLKSLTLLDLSGNNFEPPLPKFDDSVKVILNGNPLFSGNQTKESPSPSTSTSSNGTSSSGESTNSTTPGSEKAETGYQKRSILTVVLAIAIGCIIIICLLIIFAVYHYKKKKTKGKAKALNTAVVNRNDASDPHNIIKISVLDITPQRLESESVKSNVAEAGNLLVSFHVIRNVTNNFDSKTELGRGGFGAVYKGVFQDGSHIAVKRMEGGVITTKALDEFRSEIAVLSSVRHRHLVSLLGYSVEGNERLLVYEYMSQGALSRHLFNWKNLNLDPLSWTRRLTIALDVARGIEYLHTLAHQSFIHRDLKSSNILLDDDYRAKVSDFGLVKLAPDKEMSVATRLAGTFGYLAPEYAVTGKVTTKIDVFSFGVVLMELLTGLVALDEQRSDENRYLAEWFCQIKADKEKLLSAIDPALNAKEDTLEGIQKIAELAGFCTSRDPNHRPDMGHVVNVLSPLVQKWKPFDGETDEGFGIDYNLPLPEMIKDWKESETKISPGVSFEESKGSSLGVSFEESKGSSPGVSFEESKGSSPDRPDGIKETFGSADAR